MWPHMTESDPEVSFDRKSPGSGCRRCISRVFGTFELLQGCNSQEVAVMLPHVTESDPEMTSFDRNSPGRGCRRRISQVLGTFELLQGCNSQEVAVTWQEMTSRDLTCPEVTQKWRHLSVSHLERAVKGVWIELWVRFSSNKAVTRRR